MSVLDDRLIKSMRRKDRLALFLSDDRVKKFWANVKISSTCWLHQKPDCRGYAAVYLQPGCMIPAHRFALLRRRGKVPLDGMYACHRCRNKHCVRPSHLYWGTPKQNNQDMAIDGTRNPTKGTAHFRAKINEETAVAMVKTYRAGIDSVESIARKFGVSHSCVDNVLTGRTWRDATEGMRVPLRALGERAIKKGNAHYLAKIAAKDVPAIRRRWDSGESSIAIAVDFGVASRTIRDIGNLITWKHIP